MLANSGIITAHRNGLLRAQAEHSSSQPIAGSAQTAYTGRVATSCAAILSGWAGPHTSVTGLPPCTSTTPLMTTRKPNIVISPAMIASSGATTAALATFDSTVSRSDTGSDFQNSTLRSLRSSYSAPRQ